MKPRLLTSVRTTFPLASAVAALLAASASKIEAQLYYKSTTAANAWTGNFWSSNIAGPYNTAWVNNSNVVFLDNGGTALALTGATTNFASITANENVNVTASGTLGTNGTVATITVAAGKNMNFGTQALSTAAGTGLIKAGDGIVTLAGGAYTGGFTLNAGTVALSGVNGMGAGGALTINGGTIRSNSTTARDLSGKYTGGITVGGNFALGDVTNNGLLTFTNNVALGATNRIITANSAATFGGIVSATGAFGFTKLGAGDLRLNAANTFTGALNVNDGTVTIGNYTGLDSAVNLGVGSTGILRYVVVGTGATSDTNSNALSLNGGILRTAGGSGSDTIALTWAGNTTLTANSTINSHGNGIFDFDGTVDLGANALTFQTDASFGSNRIDGVISGTGGSLNKTGVSGSSLILGNANTFTGTTTISAGVLSLANANALQNTSGITMANGTTLRSTVINTVINAPIGITTAATIQNNAPSSGTSTRNLTLGGAITGTGNVTFLADLGTNSYALTTLNAASSYIGNTTITTNAIGNQMSLVRLGIDNALPIATVLTLAGGSGTAGRFTQLDLRGFNQEIAGLTGAMTGGRTLQIINSTSATPTGTLTINTPVSTSFTFSGKVGNAGTPGTLAGSNFHLEKKGLGTQILSGINDFTGTSTVLGGILSLGNDAALRNSAFNTAGSIAGDANNGLRTTVTTLTVGGLTGGNDFSTRFTSTTGGYTGLTALTFNPNTGVTHSYAGDIGDGATGMNLTKTGAGTQTLTGTNTHTGSTTVSAGVLAVNGTLANTSTTTISGTGTLKGSGSIASSVTIDSGGTLASGTSIESLATGALSFTTGSNFEYELNKDAAATAAGDLTAVTGDLSLTGTVTLNLLETGVGAWELGNPLGDHLSGSPAADKLTLISYTGAWNGGLFTYLGNAVLDDSSILLNGQRWWFNYNDTDAGTNFAGDLGGATNFVTMTVPEPGAALLGGLGLLALLRRRRN